MKLFNSFVIALNFYKKPYCNVINYSNDGAVVNKIIAFYNSHLVNYHHKLKICGQTLKYRCVLTATLENQFPSRIRGPCLGHSITCRRVRL